MVTYLQELYLSIAKRVSVYDYNISIYSRGENGNETKSVIDIDQCCVIGRSHNSKSSRFVRVEMREEEGSVNSRNVPIQSFVNSEYIKSLEDFRKIRKFSIITILISYFSLYVFFLLSYLVEIYPLFTRSNQKFGHVI